MGGIGGLCKGSVVGLSEVGLVARKERGKEFFRVGDFVGGAIGISLDNFVECAAGGSFD